MDFVSIEKNVREILESLPRHVSLVAAAKTRTKDEVKAAIQGGVKILGYNYVQEAEQIYPGIGNKVQWHMIGHLQRNKARKAVKLFDMIETVDSVRIAETVNNICAEEQKTMPVLIEVNSGREANKSGVLVEEVEILVEQISHLPNIKVQGLMTMGTYGVETGLMRSFFQETKAVFDRLKQANIPNVDIQYLSMGMSDSYKIAIEEGANIVRIGTRLFGKRKYT